MKKLFFVLVAFATVSLASSCSKCSHCETGGVKGASYCPKDNQTAHDLAKVACEGGGGKWVND